LYTDKKENKISLIYKEIQLGCANFSSYMRRPLVIYDFAADPSLYMRKILFSFYQGTIPNFVHWYQKIILNQAINTIT
jgi:hypothetical protein